jgi:hypothetical protein
LVDKVNNDDALNLKRIFEKRWSAKRFCLDCHCHSPQFFAHYCARLSVEAVLNIEGSSRKAERQFVKVQDTRGEFNSQFDGDPHVSLDEPTAFLNFDQNPILSSIFLPLYIYRVIFPRTVQRYFQASSDPALMKTPNGRS